MTPFTEKNFQISAKYKKYEYYDSNSVRREIEYKHEKFGKIYANGININNPKTEDIFGLIQVYLYFLNFITIYISFDISKYNKKNCFQQSVFSFTTIIILAFITFYLLTNLLMSSLLFPSKLDLNTKLTLL